ncbi:MAG: hypothetical protein ACRDKS_09350, partial [Actinomycetota bacterium]
CSTIEPPLTEMGRAHVAACHFQLKPEVAAEISGALVEEETTVAARAKGASRVRGKTARPKARG